MSCKISVVKLVMCLCAIIGFGLLIWLCVISFGSHTKLPTTQLDDPNWIEELSNSSAIFSSCDYENDDLHRIVSSVVSVLAFMDKHMDDLIIYGAIGTRILEGKSKICSQLIPFNTGSEFHFHSSTASLPTRT